ncbi:MAG TPA: hypothetical protein VNM92_16085 [Thermoanaerobaculia bacterium]|nr:hypothetical protein [Thermoanaerobaculia bacterium]
MTRIGRIVVIAVVVLLLPQIVQACPVCFGGDPNDPMNQGASKGIMFLLAVVGLVQLGFIALFWTFWRRGKAVSERGKGWRVIRGGAQ